MLVSPTLILLIFFFFFFNDTATTEIYTLSLHDALPILRQGRCPPDRCGSGASRGRRAARCQLKSQRVSAPPNGGDRKSTRLNSSHGYISYAVFCLKKKKKRTKKYSHRRHEHDHRRVDRH